MLQAMPCVAGPSRKSSPAHWPPRSKWWISGPSGRRAARPYARHVLPGGGSSTGSGTSLGCGGSRGHHHRQVVPALGRRDVGEVRRPTLVRRRCRGVRLAQVPRNATRWLSLRRHPKAPLGTAPKPLQAHQVRHLVPTRADTLGNQIGVNPQAAVDPFACALDAPDLGHQLSISLRPIALRPGSPGVIRAEGVTAARRSPTRRTRPSPSCLPHSPAAEPPP